MFDCAEMFGILALFLLRTIRCYIRNAARGYAKLCTAQKLTLRRCHEPRRGPIVAGEKIQFTDRKGKKITDQLTAGGVTQTEHGIILHDDVIGRTEGVVVTTVTAKREAQVNADHPERDRNKPWKATRAIGGWQYAVMRPRLADYVLSMPRAPRSCTRRTSRRSSSSATSEAASTCSNLVPDRAR